MSNSTSSFLTTEPSDLIRAANLLRQGECVALPTETVYGLAANALNPEAVRKIFTIKGRPLIDPLIVHVADFTLLQQVAEYDSRLEKIKSFWPGPLTVVLRRKSNVPDLVTAGKSTVAVRIPAHPVFRQVIELSGCPLAAPSANPFGYVSPTRAQHVADSLGNRCPWIVDGGPCQYGLESTILDLSSPDKVRLLRFGPITVEQLEEKLGKIEIVTRQENQAEAALAPGMLDRHYSPHTPIKLIARGADLPSPSDKTAYLLLSRRLTLPTSENIFYLSESGLTAEAAPQLFALLRQLDQQSFALIWAELAEPQGIGLAFNDRLTRAATR